MDIINLLTNFLYFFSARTARGDKGKVIHFLIHIILFVRPMDSYNFPWIRILFLVILLSLINALNLFIHWKVNLIFYFSE